MAEPVTFIPAENDRGSTDDLMIFHEVVVSNAYRLSSDQLNGSGIALDLGAHHGAFTLLALSLGAKHVVAVEADETKLDAFRENLVLNGYTTYPEGAVDLMWAAVGTGVDAGLVQSGSGGACVVEGNTIPGISLHGLLERLPGRQVDVCKIDVEGSEYDLILSASREELHSIKYITMEWHVPGYFLPGKNNDNEQVGRLFHKLVDAGFKVLVEPYSAGTGGMLYAHR